jgi:hypothetical protein
MIWTCCQRAAARLRCLLVRQRHCRPHLTAPDAVQAGVDNDPVQPRRHRGVAAESVRPPEGRNERILYCVRRLLRIAEGPQGDRPQPVAVAAEQLAERVRVAVNVPTEQLGV